MSLHNLATVFGPTLLRPSEKENKLPANPSQAISMTDSWSLEVMSQVRWACLPGLDLWPLPAPRTPASCQGFPPSRAGEVAEVWGQGHKVGCGSALCSWLGLPGPVWGTGWGPPGLCCEGLAVPRGPWVLPGSGGASPSLSRRPLPLRPQVQVLLYFLQLEAIPAPDSRRQSVLFSTEV